MDKDRILVWVKLFDNTFRPQTLKQILGMKKKERENLLVSKIDIVIVTNARDTNLTNIGGIVDMGVNKIVSTPLDGG